MGAVYYIDRQLNGVYGLGNKMYLSSPFAQGEPTQGYQLPLRPREVYRLGIADVNNYCRANYQSKSFAELSEGDRDTVLTGLEQGEITLAKVPAQVFFPQLLQRANGRVFEMYLEAWATEGEPIPEPSTLQIAEDYDFDGLGAIALKN